MVLVTTPSRNGLRLLRACPAAERMISSPPSVPPSAPPYADPYGGSALPPGSATPPPAAKSGSSVWKILGIIAGIVVLLCVVLSIGAYFVIRRASTLAENTLATANAGLSDGTFATVGAGLETAVAGSASSGPSTAMARIHGAEPVRAETSVTELHPR